MDPPNAAFDAVIGTPDSEVPMDCGVPRAAESWESFGMPALLCWTDADDVVVNEIGYHLWMMGPVRQGGGRRWVTRAGLACQG